MVIMAGGFSVMDFQVLRVAGWMESIVSWLVLVLISEAESRFIIERG